MHLLASLTHIHGYLGSVCGFLPAAARMHDCTPKSIPRVSESTLSPCALCSGAMGGPVGPGNAGAGAAQSLKSCRIASPAERRATPHGRVFVLAGLPPERYSKATDCIDTLPSFPSSFIGRNGLRFGVCVGARRDVCIDAGATNVAEGSDTLSLTHEGITCAGPQASFGSNQ